MANKEVVTEAGRKMSEIKKRKTYNLRLTKFELLHLRDLFSVVLPPEAKQTLSQALAELEGRGMVEAFLWKKVYAMCEEAGLPIGDEAPDYVVAPASPPPMGVFLLSSEPPEEEEQAQGPAMVTGDED